MNKSRLKCSVSQIFGVFILDTLMCVFTLFLCWPFAVVNFVNFLCNNTVLKNGEKLVNRLTASELYLWFLKAIGLTIVTLGLYTLVAPYSLLRFIFDHLSVIVIDGEDKVYIEINMSDDKRTVVSNGLKLFGRNILSLLSLGFSTPYGILNTFDDLIFDMKLNVSKNQSHKLIIRQNIKNNMELKDEWVSHYLTRHVVCVGTLMLYMFQAFKLNYSDVIDNLTFNVVRNEQVCKKLELNKLKDKKETMTNSSMEVSKEKEVGTKVDETNKNETITLSTPIIPYGAKVEIIKEYTTNDSCAFKKGAVFRFVKWSGDKKYALVWSAETNAQHEIPSELIKEKK